MLMAPAVERICVHQALLTVGPRQNLPRTAEVFRLCSRPFRGRMINIAKRIRRNCEPQMDFSKAKILCLGDLMLDRFAYCDTERISPEAPVPVLLLKRTQSMLGGAGNVARNIAALGGKAILMGLLGTDSAGAEVCRLIEQTPGLTDGHVASARRPTICKTRYLAGHQQIVRVDEESSDVLKPDEKAALVAAVEHTIADVDAVILSDYGKAVLAPEVIEAVIARGRALGVRSMSIPRATISVAIGVRPASPRTRRSSRLRRGCRSRATSKSSPRRRR